MLFIDIILILFSIVSVIIIHEVLHIIGLSLFNIKFNIMLKKKFGIPISFYIYSYYFNDKFVFLPRNKQIQFIIIVLIPYIVILPFFYFISLTGVFIITFFSLVIIISQLINFPLEFIGVKS